MAHIQAMSNTKKNPLSYSTHLPPFSNMSSIALSSEIPFQPGCSINFAFAQKNMRFPKAGTLSYGNGIYVDKLRQDPQEKVMGTNLADVRPGWSLTGGKRVWSAPVSFAHDVQGARRMNSRRSVASYLERPRTLPAFVHVDKVVLRFKCWIKDDLALLTGPDRIIIHKVVMSYHLIDDSFSMMEPRQENSGLNQGCILRRQRLMKPDGSGPYTWKDLSVGVEIVCREQVIHLIDCDDYTRKWYAEQGIEMGQPLPAPMDPNEVREGRERKKRKDYEMAKQRRIQAELMQVEEVKHRFLTYDRKVLRFYAIWDDRISIFGQRHYLTLRFYLFDYTCDVQEYEGSKTGKKSRFLVRQRIPKGYRNLDDLKNGSNSVSMDDLYIGAKVNIFGKDLFIYDCDDFTRRYYSSTFGETMQPISVNEPAVPIPRLPTPPSNGMGAEEDSIQNCKMLRPKPAYKDMAKYKKFAGKIMRFTARWDSNRPEEECRSFIISFYSADDTVSIWETSGNGRNTGMASGKFLERMKLIKPGTSGTKIRYYKQSDFFVGATIVAQTRRFVLTSMDNFTSRLMDLQEQAGKEKKSEIPPHLRLRQRLTGVEREELLEAFRMADRGKRGSLLVEEFMDVLSKQLYGFSDNDIMDLVDIGREGPRDFTGQISYENFFQRIFGGSPGNQGGVEPEMAASGMQMPEDEEMEDPIEPAGAGVMLPPISQQQQYAEDEANMGGMVQWMDEANGVDYMPPEMAGQWQQGGLPTQESIEAIDEYGDQIEWASGNQYF